MSIMVERGIAMPFEIIRNDITNMRVDAVVNTVSPQAEVGSGVDAGIHKKAGSKLLEARRKIGVIDVGHSAITSGYGLDSKYVIHTVCPLWNGGENNEEKLLGHCYKSALELAKRKKCGTVAFPLLSSGNLGFPSQIALQIAVREISSFLMENEMTIYLVVFNHDAFELSEKLFSSVKSFIDENYIQEKCLEEYKNYPSERRFLAQRRFSRSVEESCLMRSESVCCDSAEMSSLPPTEELESVLSKMDAGFSETLLRLIDKTGKKDSDIYKRANIDRKLFSKIRNNRDYRPSKATAVAFAVALELDLEQTKDLISRAGYALSHSSKFDIIVEYFILHKNYDVFELNEVLFAFDQPLIGA